MPSDADRSYEGARAWLYGLARGGVKLGLERTHAILAAMGRPDRKLRFVHVAGTNGKGSVSAMIHRALVLSGARAGLFTSPHLHTVRERIVIAEKAVGERLFASEVARLRRHIERGECPAPTFFEAITVLALACFAGRVDVVVLEVGLGGRLDSTNAVENVLVSVITSIALDHESWLGSTVERIAAEKAGILRAGVPAIVSVADRRAARVIGRIAKRVGAPLLVPSADEKVLRALAGTRPALLGEHQEDNARTATAALLALPARLRPRVRTIREALRTVRWPGRLEHVAGEPSLLFDAAHNPSGVDALARYLAELPRGGRRVLLFGVMSDKDWPRMLRALGEHFDERVYVAPNLGRAERLEHLDAFAPGHMATSLAEGLETARVRAGSRGLVVVAGSIFVVAEARALSLGLAQEPPIAM